MDELQVQHAFDRIEEHLAEIKEAALNNSSEYREELEDKIQDLEEQLSDKENEAERIKSDLDDYKSAVKSALPKLESICRDISRDYPTYDISDLEDAISILDNI